MQYKKDVTLTGLMQKDFIDWELSRRGFHASFYVLDKAKIIQSLHSAQERYELFNLIYYGLHGIRTRQSIEYLTIYFKCNQLQQICAGCFDILHKKAFGGCCVAQATENNRNLFDLFF